MSTIIKPIITDIIDDVVEPIIEGTLAPPEPELIHWWDFSDTSTLTLGGGGEISAVTAKAGAIDLEQTTLNLQPLSGTLSYGGFNYAEFGAGGTKYLDFVGGEISLEDTTIFVVCVTTNATNRQVLINGTATFSTCDLVNGTPFMRIAGGDPYWGTSISTLSLSLSTVSVCGWVLDTAGPVTFFLNASEDTGATSDGSGTAVFGRIGEYFLLGRPFIGGIREVKVFNTTDLVRVRELRDNLVNR